jgi:anti-sigma factor RsiW
MLKLFRNRRYTEEQVDELLSAHLDGALTPDEQAQLQARLEREPGLQGRLAGLRLMTEALAALPQVEAPRNFILSPALVAAPTAPAAPRQRPGWLALGWATTAATLLLIIVLAGDIFVVAPSTRQEPSDVVALVTGEPQPATNGDYVPAVEVMLESEEQDAAQTTLQDVGEPEMQPPAAPAEAAAPVEAAPVGAVAEGETEAIEQPVAEAISEADSPAEEEMLAGAASQTPPAQRAVVTATTDEAAPEMAFHATTEQPEPPATPMLAVVEMDDEQQTALPPTEKSEATEPSPQPKREAPTDTIAPSPAPSSGVPLWLRGLELVLGLSVVVLAAATWMARRRKWDAD